MKSMLRAYIYAMTGLSVVMIDQVIKYYVLMVCDQRCEINQFLSFDIAFNRGVSWGMFHSKSDVVFGLITVLIALFTIFLIRMAFERYHEGKFILGEVLAITGSFSNLIDRVWYHGVVDFIELSYQGWVWPLFNIADCAIVLGVLIMLWEYNHE